MWRSLLITQEDPKRAELTRHVWDSKEKGIHKKALDSVSANIFQEYYLENWFSNVSRHKNYLENVLKYRC